MHGTFCKTVDQFDEVPLLTETANDADLACSS